jgi:HK97 family phage major capsid protein
MPAQTDAMIARLENELEERNALIEGCIASAQDKNRDLNTQEMELISGAKERIGAVTAQLDPLREASKIAIESRNRTRQLNDELAASRARSNSVPGVVEYRSAGQYVADRYLAMMGDEGALTRTEVFHRAAAHQTTADNPGLLPENIVGPIVNFVDTTRPIVAGRPAGSRLPGRGPTPRSPSTRRSGVQAGEKTELASRKMTITKTPLSPDTYGGYVNVSRQDISRSSPAILDMVINDLAGQYAIQTEAATAAALTAAAATGPVIPVTPTAANIATAIYGAAGSVYAATKGQGRTVVALSPDQLGILGPVFPSINPQNAFSNGFPASDFVNGQVGVVGLSVVMSAGLATDTILVFSTAAVNCFEARYGGLQVVEPSVWGVQVGYAGDFKTVIVEPTAIVRVTTA